MRPHVRTSPNSTVTDNYSYQNNYNTSYSRSSSPSVKNYYNSSSSSNNDKEWVNGYYRSDGTYINGYYRNKRSKTYSTNNNYNNSNPTNISKYVSTTNVNLRSSPEVADNIISELTLNDEVISVTTVGFWDKVKIKVYNPDISNYSTITGFINSRYLSTVINSENTYLDKSDVVDSKIFIVKSDKTYFCTNPDIKTMRKAFLVYGDKIYGIAESKYFVYTEFTNSYGQKSIGWLLKDDLTRK